MRDEEILSKILEAYNMTHGFSGINFVCSAKYSTRRAYIL